MLVDQGEVQNPARIVAAPEKVPALQPQAAEADRQAPNDCGGVSMKTTIEIHPHQLGKHDGYRVKLIINGSVNAARSFANMDGVDGFLDELLARHQVDAVIDKAMKPGRDVYYDLSDASHDEAESLPITPGQDAEVVPLFPNDEWCLR